MTEPSYFEKFKRYEVVIDIVDSGQDSSPSGVLKSLKKHLKNRPLDKGEEAWIVIDRDIWPSEQIEEVYQALSRMSPRGQYHFALSNPKFEFWILLHFEDGNGVSTDTDCDQKLKKYLSGYKKDLSCWNPSLSDATDNEQVAAIYKQYLEDTPNGHKAHRLLHTHYAPRPKIVKD